MPRMAIRGREVSAVSAVVVASEVVEEVAGAADNSVSPENPGSQESQENRLSEHTTSIY